MTLSILEKMARSAIKGEDIAEASKDLLSRGFITQGQHQLLTSSQWRNVGAGVAVIAIGTPDADKADGTYAKTDKINGWWM